MAKRPWLKWWPSDWLSDERVRACSYAARGLWIDMLSLMAKSDQRGVLPYEGQDRAAERLSRQLGGSPDDLRPLLAELVDEGVASLTEDGRYIVSRRMVRDEKKAEKCADAGKNGGGNPTFKGKHKGDSKGQPKGRSSLWPLASGALSQGSELNTERFRKAWEEWEKYRTERKKALTETTVKRQIKQLEKLGHDGAIASIEQSILHGWTGLFEPKPDGSSGGASAPGHASERRQRKRESEFNEDLKL